MDTEAVIKCVDMTSQIFKRLRNQITAGLFKHGDTLKLAHLSKILGVSQTPIREALIRLAEKDYLEKNDSRSYIIKKVSRQQYLELSEIRAKIESNVIRKIIEEDLVKDIEKLQNIYDHQCVAMESGNYGDGLILNRDFHGFYLHWAGIPQVAQFVENICVIAGPILSHLNGHRVTTVKDKHFHAHMLQAFRDRNTDKAVQAVHDDIMLNAEKICSIMND